MATERHVYRPPSPTYKDNNGFMKLRYSGSEALTDANKEEALEAHRRAMFVIHKQKRDVPSFEQMKDVVMESNKLASVKENIEALKNDHLEDLKKLSAEHTDEYNQEIMDRYVSNDESWYKEDNVNDASVSRLQEILYTGPSRDALMEARWKNDYEQLRYTYLSQLLFWKREQLYMEKLKEEERKRWEKEFPISIDDYNKKGRDIQLRAARYLVAGEHEKEKMRSSFSWASRQTKPLEDIFKRDKTFEGNIRGLVLSSDVSSDPRTRH